MIYSLLLQGNKIKNKIKYKEHTALSASEISVKCNIKLEKIVEVNKAWKIDLEQHNKINTQDFLV